MNYALIDILSYSILPAACICLMRYTVILKTYRPFIWLVWLSLLNELLSSVLIHYRISNACNNNCFILIEWWLYIALFIRWQPGRKSRLFYTATGCTLTAVWLYDNVWYGSIWRFNSWFRIGYSFVLVLMAINQMNALIVAERKNILNDARFLISAGIIVYFCYKAIVEIWYLLHLYESKEFETALFIIPVIVNVLSNSIYTIASLCLPRKQKFSMLY
ncbi:MAG TPA: hypothetical protein VHP12_09895 [Chitinophagaceae bacterium]|nr:hypothetical protein [Chitinophagaceae bacterium]